MLAACAADGSSICCVEYMWMLALLKSKTAFVVVFEMAVIQQPNSASRLCILIIQPAIVLMRCRNSST